MSNSVVSAPRKKQMKSQNGRCTKKNAKICVPNLKVWFFARFFFHFFVVVLYQVQSICGLYSMWWKLDEIGEEYFVLADAPFFMTNWNYSYQTLFFSMSLYCDILEWMDKHNSKFGKKLQYYRDIVFSALVFPFTLFVTAMFWSVYLVDREMVFPKVFDAIVPWWFNHCVHTNITIMVIIETILQPRRHPVNRKFELCIVGVTEILYAIVFYSIFFFTNHWLYPVFGAMTWWQVVLFQLLICVSCYVFYFIQYPIARLIHGPEPEEMKEIQNHDIESGEECDSAFDKTWSLRHKEDDSSKL